MISYLDENELVELLDGAPKTLEGSSEPDSCPTCKTIRVPYLRRARVVYECPRCVPEDEEISSRG